MELFLLLLQKPFAELIEPATLFKIPQERIHFLLKVLAPLSNPDCPLLFFEGLEQSARASGASWLQTMWMVMLPLLRPAIVAAWLMLFVIFIRELGATILLYASGTETISVALVQLSERSFGYVAALAIVQIGLLLGAFALFKRTGASILEG